MSAQSDQWLQDPRAIYWLQGVSSRSSWETKSRAAKPSVFPCLIISLTSNPRHQRDIKPVTFRYRLYCTPKQGPSLLVTGHKRCFAMAPGHKGEPHVSTYVSPVAKDWTDKPQLGQMENPLQTHTVGKGLACDKGMPTPTTAGRVLAALSTHMSPP